MVQLNKWFNLFKDEKSYRKFINKLNELENFTSIMDNGKVSAVFLSAESTGQYIKNKLFDEYKTSITES